MRKGKFIVLEGSEGAGKTSQLKKIAEYFGDDVVITREPGGTPFAEEIREVMLNSEHAGQADAKTHFALIWASRADHLKNKIIPALAEGKTVISDRFDSSTYAYQIFGQEAEHLKDDFHKFREFFVGDCTPDLYIYMDVDVETGLSRKQVNQKDELNHFDNRKMDFFDRMKRGYVEFMEIVPSVVIDASPDFDTVTKSLIEAIESVK